MDYTKEDLITVDLSSLSNNSTTWVDGHGDVHTVPVSTGIPISWPDNSSNWTFQDLSITTPSQSGKIRLQGDDADIEINGESVVGMLREIRDRLNILQVSEEMEAEWDELRVLRQQYEAKLAECRDKSRAWKALQQKG